MCISLFVADFWMSFLLFFILTQFEILITHCQTITIPLEQCQYGLPCVDIVYDGRSHARAILTMADVSHWTGQVFVDNTSPQQMTPGWHSLSFIGNHDIDHRFNTFITSGYSAHHFLGVGPNTPILHANAPIAVVRSTISSLVLRMEEENFLATCVPESVVELSTDLRNATIETVGVVDTIRIRLHGAYHVFPSSVARAVADYFVSRGSLNLRSTRDNLIVKGNCSEEIMESAPVVRIIVADREIHLLPRDYIYRNPVDDTCTLLFHTIPPLRSHTAPHQQNLFSLAPFGLLDTNIFVTYSGRTLLCDPL